MNTGNVSAATVFVTLRGLFCQNSIFIKSRETIYLQVVQFYYRNVGEGYTSFAIQTASIE
jgi:hypothetical protein